MKTLHTSETDAMASVAESSTFWKHVSAEDWNNWKWQLAHSPNSPDELVSMLPDKDIAGISESAYRVTELYRFRATPYYLSLIDWNDSNDPVRRQCLPDAGELCDGEKFAADPFCEADTMREHGIVHRYPDRVLLTATTSCAMYCRHCTRKNILEKDNTASGDSFKAALDYIRAHSQVREVLISGGDPLLLSNAVIDELLGKLSSISHVEVLRIGTRLPVVLPMRIDEELVDILRRHRPVWINTQFNHPRELTPESIAACNRLTDAGIPLSNQSVLLKGINDSFEIMRELCAALQRNLVRPYYVFLCDPVAGIAPFRTTVEAARRLQMQLRETLGGLALPTFVADIPGKSSKTPL
jgi:lysine 2,3-aminomutase